MLQPIQRKERKGAKNAKKGNNFLGKWTEIITPWEKATPWEKIASERIARYTERGLVLRGARYRKGLSQKELAKKSGFSQENISKMENGKRVIGEKLARRLGKILHVDYEMFLI